jgi:hypothetical protein
VLSVTPKFLTEISRSHRIVSYVDVVSPTGRTERLTATDGSVQVDRTADIRRRSTISCVDQFGLLTPSDFETLLKPYGTIVKPYRGVIFADGKGSEVVPLGVFMLSKSSVRDQVGGSPSISLDCYDLSRKIRRAKFTDVYTVDTGTNLVTAIKSIVERTLPDVQYDTISSALTAPAPVVFDANTDPWEAVNTLASSLGCEALFDAYGRFVLAPPPDIDHLPAANYSYVEGNGCTMLDLSVDYSDEPGYNGVVFTGGSPGDDSAPVRSIVWDTQTDSPTYHLGPYGEVPTFVNDQNVTTQEDADAAAAAQLSNLLGFTSQLSVTATVNPALDCGDVVQVTRMRSGIASKYAVDALSIPLHASGTSSITLRQKRTV